MEAASVFAQLNRFPQSSGHQTSICRLPRSFNNEHFKPIFVIPRRNNGISLQRMRRSNPVCSAVTEFSGFPSDPGQAVITWQIVVGSLKQLGGLKLINELFQPALHKTFVVAGIEFSKRIVKQRQCEVCRGSGLVLRADKQYIRCPGCVHFKEGHSFNQNGFNSQPQQYLEITRPLPFDSLEASCTLPILSHNFSNTYGLPPVSVPYSPPSKCRWTNVVLEIRNSCHGLQFDRIAAVWLSGAELIRTSTAEPTEEGIFWVVRKDVTRYSSLLGQDNLTLSMMLENVVDDHYTGIFQVNITFHYYDTSPHRTPLAQAPEDSVCPLIDVPGDSEIYHRTSRELNDIGKGSFELYDRPADLILPISSGGEDGFWFRIQNQSQIHSKRLEIPSNTYRAVIEVYLSGHGDDEVWYANPPDGYSYVTGETEAESKYGHGAHREVLVKLDGALVGSVVPFPVIFTGGINTLFWEPVVGIGAFDLPSYDLELTPFLGLLLQGRKPHSFSLEVSDGISFWLVDANLHLWLDLGWKQVRTGTESSVPEFSLERRSQLGVLDREFEIDAERKAKVLGWMITSAGYFTTYFEQTLKFQSGVKYTKNNGVRKMVEQKVKDKSEFSIKSGNGEAVIFHTSTEREFGLKWKGLTAAKERNAIKWANAVEIWMEEKKRVGNLWSVLRNRQNCSGWHLYHDNGIHLRKAFTHQNYSFQEEGSKCYSRMVTAENGFLVGDSITTTSYMR
ncbi:OLC1v1022554C1 [Oldenlandia corymbosa var. corymbosa]|uniref:OLC1v1022554C1 n=1 Tax=Oldenlandia corymbosa var. corymbosa TaxID=529605 RepID=A0AAV1BZN2_OLDCO|nr:OLC1v1022554C1 [Oldenlandia corymbosa var. corymbosa]